LALVNRWVLEPVLYENQEQLLGALDTNVIESLGETADGKIAP
jgi:hypothetical protein